MNEQKLSQTVKFLMASGKGILAADESTISANKRFNAVQVEPTEENRRLYRQLLMTTPQTNQVLSGVILYDETFWQKLDNGKTFPEFLSEQGIMPGIKVDQGLVDFDDSPGEQITNGLDDLSDRLIVYQKAGAKFAKWRAVITIDRTRGFPTDNLIRANASILARYARTCQEYDLVPIVEPEVLLDGSHSIDECEAVMVRVYDELFSALKEEQVFLPGLILKTSMVLPGKESGTVHDSGEVAIRTIRTLRTHVPEDLGGVVFLSGGQLSDQAMENLNAIALHGQQPWGVTFSYSRALQEPVMKYWSEHRDDVTGAQQIFAELLVQTSLASRGQLKK